MKRESLVYLTKKGFKNVWVNRLMSLASVFVLLSCLIMMGLAFMVLVNIQTMIDGVEDQNVIMVFAQDEATDAQVTQLGKDLKALPNVESCTFVSKEEAFEKALEGIGDASVVFDEEEDNPLPDAYKVVVQDINLFEDTVAKIKNVTGVQSVSESREFALQLAAVRRTVTGASFGIIALLLVVSLFIISNTIRITMFSRRLEISIMKSVGATDRFIRLPFLIEGVLLGIISGVLALLVVWGIYAVAVMSLQSVFATIGSVHAVPFARYAAPILVGFLGVGVCVGVGGSFISMKKYLKEQEYHDENE